MAVGSTADALGDVLVNSRIGLGVGRGRGDLVDPLADRWFLDGTDLIGIDRVHTTDARQAYVADRIEPVVREALGG